MPLTLSRAKGSTSKTERPKIELSMETPSINQDLRFFQWLNNYLWKIGMLNRACCVINTWSKNGIAFQRMAQIWTTGGGICSSSQLFMPLFGSVAKIAETSKKTALAHDRRHDDSLRLSITMN